MAESEYCIHRASLDDVAVLTEMGVETFHEAYSSQNDPVDMEHYLASSFNPEQIASELNAFTSIFLLAYRDKKPVGYAKLDKDPPPDCVKGSRPIRLFRLYVKQSFIGKGCGSALIQSCLEEARQVGYKTIWLGVWEQNTRAQVFYERHGFTEVGLDNFHFGQDVQNDLIMERPV